MSLPAQTLHDFVLNLLTDDAARSAFATDPTAALAGAGLSDVTPQDIQEVAPLVADYAPAPAADALQSVLPSLPAGAGAGGLQDAIAQLTAVADAAHSLPLSVPGAAPERALPVSGLPTDLPAVPSLGDFPLGNLPTGGLPVAAPDLSNLPIGNLPIGQLPIGDLPTSVPSLGDLPIGDLPTSVPSLGDLPTGALPLATPDLGNLPIGNLPVDLPKADTLPTGNLPIGNLPIGQLPIGDLPTSVPSLGDLPTGALPLATPDLGNLPIGNLPIGNLPVDLPKADTLPTGNLPIGNLPIGQLPIGDLPTSVPSLGDLPTGALPLATPDLGNLPIGDLPFDLPKADSLPLHAPSLPVGVPELNVPVLGDVKTATSNTPDGVADSVTMDGDTVKNAAGAAASADHVAVAGASDSHLGTVTGSGVAGLSDLAGGLQSESGLGAYSVGAEGAPAGFGSIGDLGNSLDSDALAKSDPAAGPLADYVSSGGELLSHPVETGMSTIGGYLTSGLPAGPVSLPTGAVTTAGQQTDAGLGHATGAVTDQAAHLPAAPALPQLPADLPAHLPADLPVHTPVGLPQALPQLPVANPLPQVTDGLTHAVPDNPVTDVVSHSPLGDTLDHAQLPETSGLDSIHHDLPFGH